MGFIDYHGKKEDRYIDVLEYSRAQQEEDWKRKQERKIKKWLISIKGEDGLGDVYIQDLLKLVIVQYKKCISDFNRLMDSYQDNEEISKDSLWEGFASDFVMIHIQPFHLPEEKRKKHFITFMTKIFKLTDDDKAEKLYSSVYENHWYRKYLTECYDPTWKDRHLFSILYLVRRKNNNLSEYLDEFMNEYRLFGLVTALYLYQAVQPHDDGWILQETDEWNAINDIKARYNRGSFAYPDYGKIKKILDDVEHLDTREKNEHNNGYIREPEYIHKSKLNYDKFNACIEKGNLEGYVEACKLLLVCDLPEEIQINYNQLIERLPVLQNAIDKYDDIYHAEMDQFCDYFAPEALKLTATLLDYQVAAPSETVLGETREGVLVATKKLLLVVNEKIDEIYKFVTIETNAEAKALDSIMSQYGYVDAELLINSKGE